jgi:hypothetical protein
MPVVEEEKKGIMIPMSTFWAVVIMVAGSGIGMYVKVSNLEREVIELKADRIEIRSDMKQMRHDVNALRLEVVENFTEFKGDLKAFLQQQEGKRR